jgi:hypothetical protein
MSFRRILNRHWNKRYAALIGMLLFASIVPERYNAAQAEAASNGNENAVNTDQSARTTTAAKIEKEDQSDSDSAVDDLEKQEKKRLKQLKKMAKAQEKEAEKAARRKDREALNNQSGSTDDHEKEVKPSNFAGQNSIQTEAATEQSKDSGMKDPAVTDSAVTDSAVKDSAVTDSAVKDSGVKDSGVKDSGMKDSTVTGAGTASDTVKKEEKTAAKGEYVRDRKVNSAFMPDAALLSVLKDVAKELKETEAVKRIHDPAQRMVIDLIQEVMNKALNDAKCAPNRIVEGSGQDGSMPPMTTESWASGDVELSTSCHSSLAAVWAKRENGLLNITIAGRCMDKIPPGGKQIGEFVVVVSGRSSVERGFDIQSQSNVHFWLGKISAVTVESDGNEVQQTEIKKSANIVPAASLETSRRETMVLPAVLTERSRQYFTTMKDIPEHNHDVTDHTSATAQSASFVANITLPNGMTVQELQEAYQKALLELASNNARSEADRALKPPTASAFVLPSRKPEPLLSETNTPKESGQLPFSATEGSIHLPSTDAFLMAPERALAGQPITVIVIDGKHNGEAYVELSLNGKTAITDINGQHTFTVPEDATPGHSLNVTLAARPENSPTTVEIFQPLTLSAERQAPRIERVVPVGSHLNTIVVDGHNFDGSAGNDKTNVDGHFQGRILASSPVQLRINLPVNLQAGDHTLFVTCQGIPSNSVSFHIQATTSAQAIGSKNGPKKLAGSSRLAKRRPLVL